MRSTRGEAIIRQESLGSDAYVIVIECLNHYI